MKIERLSVNNFKGIDRLEFAPKMINLIIGKNNTGKTSLLEAIDLLFNTEKFRKYYEKHLSDIINVSSEESEVTALINSEETKLKLRRPDIINVGTAFKKELTEIVRELIKYKTNKEKLTADIKKEIEKILNTVINEGLLLELSRESIAIVKDGKEEIYFSFGSDKLKEMLENIFESISKHINKKFKIKIEPFLAIFVLQRGYATHAKNKTKINEIVIFIRELKLRGKEKISKEDKEKILKIEEYIKEYKLIKNLERFDLDYLSFKYNSKIDSIPYDFMGDGFKAIVDLIWQFLSKTKKEIVLIEEPETHMHPGYIYELIKFLIKFSREMDIQLFITSHNIDFIEGFFDENLSKEDEQYLKKELLILRMEKIKNYTISELLEYNDAKSTIDDLLIDLRGI